MSSLRCRMENSASCNQMIVTRWFYVLWHWRMPWLWMIARQLSSNKTSAVKGGFCLSPLGSFFAVGETKQKDHSRRNTSFLPLFKLVCVKCLYVVIVEQLCFLLLAFSCFWLSKSLIYRAIPLLINVAWPNPYKITCTLLNTFLFMSQITYLVTFFH